MTLREFVNVLNRNSTCTLVVKCGDECRYYNPDKLVLLKDWREKEVLCVSFDADSDGWVDINVTCKREG